MCRVQEELYSYVTVADDQIFKVRAAGTDMILLVQGSLFSGISAKSIQNQFDACGK